MRGPLTTLKLCALDIDGVLLNDTFSPVLRKFVELHGGVYDADTEEGVFSQNRNRAAAFLVEKLGLDLSEEEVIRSYFQVRAEYLAKYPVAPAPGLEGVLKALKDLGLRLLCYGGLAEDHFLRELAPWTGYFEGYVCTNDFRPGMAEIAARFPEYEPRQILFVDDVDRAARGAKALGAAFAGLPAPPAEGYQREAMVRTGVRYLLGSLEDLDRSLLEALDRDAALDQLW